MAGTVVYQDIRVRTDVRFQLCLTGFGLDDVQKPGLSLWLGATVPNWNTFTFSNNSMGTESITNQS